MISRLGVRGEDLANGPSRRPLYDRDVSEPSPVELLLRQLPILRYDSQGSFYADAASGMTDNVSSDGKRSNSLKRDAGKVIAAAKPGSGQPQLTIDFLGGSRYGDEETVAKTDYLDAVGRDYVLDARQMHARSEYANRVYGHLARDPSNGRAFLQYWFFYYWNNKAFLGFGLHEGDWEMVQIGLGDDGKPQTMVFAQHDHAERCAWSDVKRDGERPQVFVARGSQASYPRPGRHKAPLVPDQADGKGATISPALEVIGDGDPGWADWPGRWGSSRARNLAESNSPRGPRYHGQWAAPASFEAEAIERRDVAAPRVAGEAELEPPPAPRLAAHRQGDRAVVEYEFPKPSPDQPRAKALLLSVDSPEDQLPPASESFPVRGRRGSVEHPLPLEDRKYVVLGSGLSPEGVSSDTVTVPLQGG